MKILMIGSSAAGGLLGARLLESKRDVSFLVRPERQRQLVTRGLQLRSQFGAFRRPVHAITVDQLAGTYDLIVVAVRGHEMENALTLASAAIGPRTVVMPVLEGVRHFEIGAAAVTPCVIGAVFEARLLLDADGVLSQRPPAGELHIGPMRPGDRLIAEELVELFTGRGLKTIYSDRIRAKGFERFAYMAAGVATSSILHRPLRDTLRFAHGMGTFEALLKEGHRVGEAAGFAPDGLEIRKYDHAFLLEGRPVQTTPWIADGGRAADEGVFLLSEMVGLARKSRISATRFEMAWRDLTRPAEMPLSADVVTQQN